MNSQPIDRKGLVSRHFPHVNSFDSSNSLSVGNGEFAYTVDATGLQTFPELYSTGVPLGTQSQWGWHSFPMTQNYKIEEAYKTLNFKGKDEIYAVEFDAAGRQKDVANWFRANPHRIHLGFVGFDIDAPSKITDIDQTLDLWNGIINSRFMYLGKQVEVQTACHSSSNTIGAHIISKNHIGIKFHFTYPAGKYHDDLSDLGNNDKHSTVIVKKSKNAIILKRVLDETTYFVKINWVGIGVFEEKDRNYYVLKPQSDDFSFTVMYSPEYSEVNKSISCNEVIKSSTKSWNTYWAKGAAVDFSNCKDKRAPELERRVVLSQYLLAIQCAGSNPPQETGLTFNSWYGKFHLEMIWWHEAQFALWNRPELLKKTLNWYFKAVPIAKEIAKRQGYDGVRWMKMTDPSAEESPCNTGSFLIWQQPHLIYLSELVYRSNPNKNFLKKFSGLVDETAKFMYSFASYDSIQQRYVLKGYIPAQETLKASETMNSPFELSYWYYGLSVAQKWRERLGQKREPKWDDMLSKLSKLASKDGLYLAAESAPETYTNVDLTSDHMAVLGALGVLPESPLLRNDYMQNTLDWVMKNWHWKRTWGWDFGLTAMNATRLGDSEKAVAALLMDVRTNTYLPNGHNYQNKKLTIYLPGNGSLLSAISLMCAGWDGCKIKNPGFPKNGQWDVRWEGLAPMP
jgi:hypothetical protein